MGSTTKPGPQATLTAQSGCWTHFQTSLVKPRAPQHLSVSPALSAHANKTDARVNHLAVGHHARASARAVLLFFPHASDPYLDPGGCRDGDLTDPTGGMTRRPENGLFGPAYVDRTVGMLQRKPGCHQQKMKLQGSERPARATTMLRRPSRQGYLVGHHSRRRLLHGALPMVRRRQVATAAASSSSSCMQSSCSCRV